MLMDRLGMGQSAVSYHMKILCESGIVASRQEGKWTYYWLDSSGSQAAAELLVRLTTPQAEAQPWKSHRRMAFFREKHIKNF